MADQPDDASGETAGGQGAEQAPEDRAQHAARDHHQHEPEGQQIAHAALVLPSAVRRGQRLPVSDGDHLLDSLFDSSVVVPQLEMRRDRLVDDAIRDRVRQSPFQAVPHLDAYPPIVFGDQQYRAVVDPFASELPLLRNADTVLLDLLRLRAWNDQHGNLAALLGLEIGEFSLDAVDRAARERAGQVDDPPRQRRDRYVRAREQRGEANARGYRDATEAMPRGHSTLVRRRRRWGRRCGRGGGRGGGGGGGGGGGR